ncbi:2'-5' RNA ligase family protein [Paenibacillus gansuensis]|uniref:2'-5' RNA ligase family protein n=1 Tax=Paenibacillus gansuensis TaxID=306542 RepID=A0ABW5PGR4_9BACL
MSYAVEFFFDNDIERYVKDTWTELKTKNISSFMADIEELRPHITIAVYNSEIPIEQFITQFEIATNEMQPIDVKFDAISIFPTSGTLFLSPTMSSQLLNSHVHYCNALRQYNNFDNYNGYNNQDNWTPHCTLATRLNKENLIFALEHCLHRFQPLRGEIIEIGIAKLEFNNGVCVSSKTIYSKVLN